MSRYVLVACDESHRVTISSPGGYARNPKIRSKTFPGVAAAIAEQWYE